RARGQRRADRAGALRRGVSAGVRGPAPAGAGHPQGGAGGGLPAARVPGRDAPASDRPPPLHRAELGARLMLGAFITGLRPRQWTKNLLVFAGLIFSQGLNDPTLVARSVFAFAIFCLLSGSVYLINDVMDAERDR